MRTILKISFFVFVFVFLISTTIFSDEPKKFTSIEHGFIFIPPDKYIAIPIPPEYQLSDDDEEDEDAVDDKDAKGTTTDDDDDDKEKDKKKEKEKEKKPFWKEVAIFEHKIPDPEWYTRNVKIYRIYEVKTLDDACKFFKDKMKDNEYQIEKEEKCYIQGVEGKRYQIVYRTKWGSAWFRIATVLSKDERSFVTIVSSGEKYGRRHLKDFISYTNKFTFIPKETLEKLQAKRPNFKDGLPPGWKSFETEHYIIQYNTEDSFAKTLSQHLEKILEKYMELFPTEKKLTEKFTVKVFVNDDEFQSYAALNGVGGAAAYFSPLQKELVVYRTADMGVKKTFNIVYHEASHQYLHFYFGEKVDIPIWINEGVAEYFFGAQFGSSGSFIIGPNKERLPDIKEAINTKNHVPTKEIVKYSQAEYYSRAGVCYAEGWAICYFLFKTQNPQYKGRIKIFYDTLRDTKKKDKAFEKAFGDLDLDQMEKDWIAFIKKL